MAAGRICTGFSKPYVAKYVNTSGTITYTGATQLARGCDVGISANSSLDNIFYADNGAAESAGATFVDGTFSLTVDGLKSAAEALITGVTTGTDWTAYDDDQDVVYCGLGFIIRYMEDGVTSYVPFMLSKVAFDPISISAQTQESEISFQTQALSGKIFRADDAKRTWKYVGKAYSTEEAAATALVDKLA